MKASLLMIVFGTVCWADSYKEIKQAAEAKFPFVKMQSVESYELQKSGAKEFHEVERPVRNAKLTYRIMKYYQEANPDGTTEEKSQVLCEGISYLNVFAPQKEEYYFPGHEFSRVECWDATVDENGEVKVFRVKLGGFIMETNPTPGDISSEGIINNRIKAHMVALYIDSLLERPGFDPLFAVSATEELDSVQWIGSLSPFFFSATDGKTTYSAIVKVEDDRR